MPHPIDGPTSRDAVARRQRINRRQTTRRLTRVAQVVIGVFSAAALLQPLPVTPPAGAVLTRVTSGTGLAAPADTTSTGTPRHASLQKWHQVYQLSAHFRVKPDLARLIFDAALDEGIDPELGFRLVRVESRFNPRAVSPAGALGLTQLMPATARLLEPSVTRDQLLTPEINLRLGFRYLRQILREHDGDLRVALLEYNRGPAAVHAALAQGLDPTNGYDLRVIRGYRGRGLLN